MAFVMEPVAHVRGGRSDAVDDSWDSEEAIVELTDAYAPDALAGLDAFSHVEIIFVFDRVPAEKIETTARRPRGNPDWPVVGIFAQRGKNRPNRIGVTVCALLGVDGASLRVRGLDAIDGTPVLDIKPVMAEFLPRGDLRQPAWSHNLMRAYW
jgi:tRNA-Thr(GGU) m(6)t(6)A37 methyltransferase TsaA